MDQNDLERMDGGREITMNPTATKVLTSLVPAAAFGLNILVPVVPAIVWSALLNALLNGNVTLEHVEQFLKDHDIKTYATPQDFPDSPPQEAGTATPSNINKG